MEHVVFYPSVEGGSAFKRMNSLDEAVSFVEHLRNSENITDFSVHTLTPVPLAFRAYYRVEVPAGDAVTAPDQPTTEPATQDGLVAPAAATEPSPAGFELPAQPAAPESSPTDDVATAPAQGAEEDRSEAWVAEAVVVEPLVDTTEAVAAEVPAEGAAPFADAPPVSPQGTEDVVPVPTGKRSMGFFAR
jgi:hypothetical protein